MNFDSTERELKQTQCQNFQNIFSQVLHKLQKATDDSGQFMKNINTQL